MASLAVRNLHELRSELSTDDLAVAQLRIEHAGL